MDDLVDVDITRNYDNGSVGGRKLIQELNFSENEEKLSIDSR